MNAEDAEQQMAWLRLQHRTPLVGKTVEIHYEFTEECYRGVVRKIRWVNGVPVFSIDQIVKHDSDKGTWSASDSHPPEIGAAWEVLNGPHFYKKSIQIYYWGAVCVIIHIDAVPITPVQSITMEEVDALGIDYDEVFR